MAFSEIVGHTRQVDTLRQGLLYGRLHHAYIFSGPDGVGKRTLALALAQAIYCAAGNGDFCGKCGPCVTVQRGNHADVRILRPLDGKKEITIQQVRELEKELALRSLSGKKKIAIVDPATLMNWPAQNALLKTLEEPPQDCILILIAVSAGGLLPTVRSRAFSLTFAGLPRRVVSEHLISKGKTQEHAESLAALSMGSLGAASKIENERLIEKRREWMEMLSSLTLKNYRGALAAAEALASDRDETLRFLDWAAIWYRDLLTFRFAQSRDEIVNVDLMGQIEEQSVQSDEEQLFLLIAKTAEASRLIHRNVNRRMVIEDLLLDVVEKR